MRTTVALITAILTVVKTITSVLLRNTVLVRTRKLILFTCCKNQYIHHTEPMSSNTMTICTIEHACTGTNWLIHCASKYLL